MTDLAQAQARILELEAEVDRAKEDRAFVARCLLDCCNAAERIQVENVELLKELDRLSALCTELEERLKPSKFLDPNGYC